jgi:coproporphyrinogen III oxidase-like Fe-S oxidoreductase
MFSLPTLSHGPDAVQADHSDAAEELRARMQKPQRHRLLHGYPLAAAMRSREASQKDHDLVYPQDTARGLLVGVLPHPFCNPAVTGCGFCTFPHQPYNAAQAADIVEHVLKEIDGRVARQPALHRRAVTALYFGGATANLTPAGPFRRLCRKLAETFDLSGAEVTLEGVPAYFVRRRPLPVDVLREELPARHFRLSMGVQTFDEDRLRQMGRLAFGTRETFRAVADLAHRLGFTASADLLFNLPHQSLAEMKQDVREALALGLDHVGLYHLVLFRGLGTPWSRDPRLLAGLPCNETAANNWLTLRELLLGSEFYQATLTNFERAAFRGGERRFLYEECSFHPDRFDMLGFGPSAISFAAGEGFGNASRILNPDRSADYMEAVASGQPAWDRYFNYGPRDLRVFYLTRRLVALNIDRRSYGELFGSDAAVDFSREFDALSAAALVEVNPRIIRPTPRGMFYADSIAALLAWQQVRQRRGWTTAARGPSAGPHSRLNDNGFGHM